MGAALRVADCTGDCRRLKQAVTMAPVSLQLSGTPTTPMLALAAKLSPCSRRTMSFTTKQSCRESPSLNRRTPIFSLKEFLYSKSKTLMDIRRSDPATTGRELMSHESLSFFLRGENSRSLHLERHDSFLAWIQSPEDVAERADAQFRA